MWQRTLDVEIGDTSDHLGTDGRCQARPPAGSAVSDPFTSGPTECGRAVELGYGPDGKRRRKFVSSKMYATAQRELRLQVDQHGDVPTSSMPAEAWLAHWLQHIAAPRVRPETFASYRDDVRLHISPPSPRTAWTSSHRTTSAR